MHGSLIVKFGIESCLIFVLHRGYAGDVCTLALLLSWWYIVVSSREIVVTRLCARCWCRDEGVCWSEGKHCVHTMKCCLFIWKHYHLNYCSCQFLLLNSRASEIYYNIILQEKMTCFNLKPKEILMQHIHIILSRVTFLQSTFWVEFNSSHAMPTAAVCSGQQWHTQEFCSGWGFNKFSWGQRTQEPQSVGGSPLVRGSGGSCNLVQEISFHIVKLS